MINSQLLREVVKNRGVKYQYIANFLQITPYSLQKKIDNISEFKCSEISKFTKLLCITKTQRDDIFFADDVD